MFEWYPLLIIGGVIGALSLIFLIVYLCTHHEISEVATDRKMKDRELMRRLFVYAKPYWKQFLLVVVIMLVAISYDILSPILTGEIEELIKHDFPVSDLLVRVGVLASVLLLSTLAMYLQAVLLQKIGQKILSGLREDLFSHIESLSHAQLHTMPVGKLVTRVTNDTDAISRMFTNILVRFIQNCFMILGVLAAMLFCNVELTLMVLCFVPFIVFFTVIFRKFSRRAYRRVKDGTTEINTFLSEHLSGMKIIQIFNREEAKKAEFDRKNIALGRAKRDEIFVFAIFRPLVYMLYVSSVLCLLYLGGRGVIKDVSLFGQVITSGTVVTFYMFISTFFNPIQNLAEQFNWLQSALASAEKIFTLFDIQPDVVDADGARELEQVNGEIEFRNVWFAYVGEEWVLKGVSFRIRAGETAAFVGSTGSGKTTILSLLCRNYDIQRGEILLDGVNIREYKISSLRRHMGQMLQDVFLFSGTVRTNLSLREDGFTEEEIMDACRYVGADSFLSRLSRGLDAEVLERGNNFSAGQRQLLSFARTILHRPEIMILDEATANIDTETERLIQDSLEKMRNIGTMLVVAHRLSTIQNADHIIVLSHGEILEEGTHTELLKKKGRYYRLYLQTFEKQNREKDLYEKNENCLYPRSGDLAGGNA